MPDVPVRMNLLKKMHLFRGLNDAQLTSIASNMEEDVVAEDQKIILEQGTITDFFYIIFNGNVNIVRTIKKKDYKVTSLFRGDYFGENSLVRNVPHNATVRASQGTILLKLPRSQFVQIMRDIPDFRQNIAVMMKSRDLAQKLKFKWLNENEVIYFLSRRHDFMLYQAMIGPGMGMVIILALVFSGIALHSTALYGISAVAAALIFLWGLWLYIDWSNDYYVVTNLRVINIEKVVAMYDSREESPINTIVSVNGESDQLGRIFRYGTVIVRTITGEMRMHFTPRPKHAVVIIEEYVLRTKDIRRQNDENIMKEAIRKKLGLTPPAPNQPAPPPQKTTPKASLSGSIGEYIREIFYARKEEGDTVTYHKHWVVLFKYIAAQTLALIGLISVYPLWYYFSGKFVSLAFGSIIGVLIIADLVWWVYGFLDWKNDLYQITPDQILDIYRVPFGDEERKSAPLENILSTNYQRNGFWGLLFNYGTVKIQVGNINFDFLNVANPPAVQQDIIKRVNVRQQKKREADTAAERDRMAEWLAMYHKTMSEIDKQASQARE